MTLGRRITTREATVRTATVEIKTLTVSGRQVTLSLFRQLLNEDIIDPETGTLRGVPWGTVNYFWAGCGLDKVHLHVVWQKGDELRRACVPERHPLTSDYGSDIYWAHKHDVEQREKLAAEVDDPLKLLVLDRCLDSIPTEREDDDKLVIRIPGWTFRRPWPQFAYAVESVEVPPTEWELKPRTVAGPRPETDEEVKARMVERLRARIEEVRRQRDQIARQLQVPTDEATEGALRLIFAWTERWTESQKQPDPSIALRAKFDRLSKLYAEQYAAIAALDQLFIAA